MKTYESGFSLVEILVALAILSIVLVGALGVIGGTSVGGLLEAFPTGFIAGRAAKDITVAGSYLHALHEFVAANSSGAFPGLFCLPGTGACGVPSDLVQRCPNNSAPSSFVPGLPVAGAPTPQSQPYQLQWATLHVLVENWYWDESENKYSVTAAPTTDKLIRVCSVLKWELKDASRVLAVDRFTK